MLFVEEEFGFGEVEGEEEGEWMRWFLELVRLSIVGNGEVGRFEMWVLLYSGFGVMVNLDLIGRVW